MLLFCSQWVKAASGVWRGLNFGRVVVEGGKLGVPAVLAFCLSVTSRRACTATRSPASPPGGDLLIGCDKRPWGDALGELAFHVILLSWFLRHAGVEVKHRGPVHSLTQLKEESTNALLFTQTSKHRATPKVLYVNLNYYCS
jgi:hypothetical protein